MSLTTMKHRGNGDRAMMPRGFLGTLACLTLLAACGHAGMSVEEARKVTASFSDTAFAPPPKTIKDISAILDQQKPADPATLAANLARLEAKPPATADPAALAAFYRDRGVLAYDLGRMKQAMTCSARRDTRERALSCFSSLALKRSPVVASTPCGICRRPPRSAS